MIDVVIPGNGLDCASRDHERLGFHIPPKAFACVARMHVADVRFSWMMTMPVLWTGECDGA